MEFNTNRRQFIIRGGALVGGGFFLAYGLDGCGSRENTHDAGALAAGTGDGFRHSAFLHIGADNIIKVTVGMSEMGQGVLTSLPQIVAEELDADWSRVRVEQAPADDAFTNPMMGMQATGGSMSVRAFYEPMRKVGATARAMLISAAAAEWGVDAGALRTESGAVVNGNRRLSYGQLATRAATMPVPKDVKLKSQKDFRIVGTDKARLDLAGKVNGTAQFGIDVRVSGMLTAVVGRAPVLGAKVKSVDSRQTLAVAGVKQVVTLDTGVAVIADGFYAARKGRDALQIRWSASPHAKLSSAGMKAERERLLAKGGMVARDDGNVAAAQSDKSKGTKTLNAIYDVPYLAHACMEPLNATVSVTDSGAEIWAPTQSPGLNRTVVAQVLGLKPEQVNVHVTLLGGGFGRRFAQDFIIDAALLSKAAKAPVQLIYTREDDMHAQHYRPAATVSLKATLSDAGAPVAIAAHTVCSSVMESAGFAKAGSLDEPAVEGLSTLPYDIPNVKVEWTQHEPGIKVWFLRSVGNSQNGFIAESFIDECAIAAGKDPYEYRRALLTKKPRHLNVLEVAAHEAGWGAPVPKGRARGIALVESFGSFVAEVAEISRTEDGAIRVHRVVCAVDCGQVINPAIVQRQMQSAVNYGLSAALYGKITMKDGAFEQGNFNTYPVVRISEAPVIEVHIVPSTEPPGGVGEPGTPPIAPAVANAWFALTGERLRSLPLSRT
jgi:isoquinoline 1-oxidoreductase beta subunit